MFRKAGHEKTGKVLYCAAIPVLIYPLLMHKLGMNPDKNAVLFIDRNEYAKRTDIEAIHRFKAQGIFADVVDCNIFGVVRGLGISPKDTYIEYFDNIFLRAGYQLTDFDEIYVLNDSWDGDINLYFNFKRVAYFWINFAKDYVPNIYTFSKCKKELLNEYKALTPFAKYAKPCILAESDQLAAKLEQAGKDFSTWDLMSLYKNLSFADVEKVVKSYGVDKLPSLSKSTLIIKNSGWVMDNSAFKGWGSSETYVRLLSGVKQYTMDDFTPFFDVIALDFFSANQGNIYIKEHPNCPLNAIQKAIYSQGVLPLTKMPFEFLVKYFTQKGIQFDTVIGYLSTSLLAVDASISQNLYVLGEQFLRTCFFYSSLYTTLLYAAHCGLKSIYCNDTVRSQLAFLLKTMNTSVDLQKYDPCRVKNVKDALFVLDYVLEGRGVQKDFLTHIHNSSAVCFLNVELTEEFFDDSLMGNMVPVEIKKEKIAEGFMNLQRDETLWIYTKSNAILKATRFFTMEKILPRCGLRVYVEESTLAEGVELFQERSQRWKLKKLSTQVETLTKALQKIGDTELLTGMLQVETDVCKYVELLWQLQSKYWILLSVRDTPGDCLPEEAVRLLHELGFTKFSKELWRMYIGVSRPGEVLCDRAGESREAPVDYQCQSGLSVTVSSMAWRQGNKAEIVIDGTDYAVNLRGLNFVVYDTEHKRLVDSVGFDCHTGQWRIQRRNSK